MAARRTKSEACATVRVGPQSAKREPLPKLEVAKANREQQTKLYDSLCASPRTIYEPETLRVSYANLQSGPLRR